MYRISIIGNSLFRRDHRPFACPACLSALALLAQLVAVGVPDAAAYTTLSSAQVETMVENGTAGTVIDVRESGDFCGSGHIPCAINYPWNTGSLQSRYTELDPDAMLIVVCLSGIRSAQASSFLEDKGFTRIFTMSGGMSTYQGETQDCDAECPVLYFPHIATANGWQTEIAVINTGDQRLTGTLRGMSDEGRLMETMALTLSAHGRKEISIEDEFTNHGAIGYIIFDTNSTTVQGYTRFFQEGYYRTAIPAVKGVNAADVYISHIASTADWWTGLSLVNTTSRTKELTFAFNNGLSSSITLNAYEHKAFDIESLFNYQPHPDIQSAVIIGAGGVIGLELFSSIGWGAQLEGILLTDKTTSTIYYPHVAGNEWWTGIVAYNPSEFENSITVTPYSDGGTSLPSSTISITENGKYIGLVSDLDLPAQTAWVRIDSTRPMSGFELFGTTNGSRLAAYASRGRSAATEGVFPKIEKNDWTGVAFVNTEAAPASVTLIAYDDDGNPVAAEALDVDGYAKVVSSVEEIFSQDIGSAAYIAYRSSGNVAGFQLNSSTDGTMLDGLPALGGAN